MSSSACWPVAMTSLATAPPRKRTTSPAVPFATVAAAVASVEPWPPTRWSPPLPTLDGTPWRSAADPYLPALRFAWRFTTGHDLDLWQVSIVRAVLEIVPEGYARAGRLRWRQVLVSMGRQNGKSEIAALLGILMLLMRRSPYVVGIASNREQAALIFRRALTVVEGLPALRRRFKRATDTRGLATRTGGLWELKAARAGALQGIPIDLAFVDEVHLVALALWSALLAGTGGRDDCLVVGTTTAGDESSALLAHLYALADKADPSDPDATFGFFIWEAPEARVPDDDPTFALWLALANPGIACGRVPVANVIRDARSTPPLDVVRYRLNRSVKGSAAAFVPLGQWLACGLPAAEFASARPTTATPGAGRLIFTIDRTPEWAYAAITATRKAPDGTLFTEVVASLVRPDLARLVDLCVSLSTTPQASGALFVCDGYSLKDLGDALTRRGLAVQILRGVDVVSAASLAYSKIVRGEVRHPLDPLLTDQVPRTARRNVGNAFKVVRAGPAENIDAAMATVFGLYVADTTPDYGVQVF